MGIKKALDWMLEITFHEICGKCPVYKVGDKIIVDDPKIMLNKTDALCTHTLSTILHYVLILKAGAKPVKLGL
ncbi:MAG: TIGR04076 family protein [Clostridiales bacterium]|nr:TIGR04076 family protein [Clostridiales bacterium]